ncbi:MAG: hypothetical protein GC166_00130 [Alphaproteobacteria bacterium]|nr:hypothetical protein [Alphaproteobacteria bacterium]
MTPILASPFHARTASSNIQNAWTSRNGFTLATAYASASEEALAARTSVVIADISWRWRVMLQGPNVKVCLDRLLTRDVGPLEPGSSLKALWLSDGGGVRGAGAIARFGKESFLLVSAARDARWIEMTTALFGVRAHDITLEQGGISVVGPYAQHTLSAAGLDPEIEPLQFRKLFWRGLDVTLSRWGELGGYEIWCGAEDAIIVWDRIVTAGTPFNIQPAGLSALDVLDVEAGVARPLRDWMPANDGNASIPSPFTLKLERLIDDAKLDFNGRTGWISSRSIQRRTLIGLELESDIPAPHAPLFRDGQLVGHTMTSVYSPGLRRAIALALVDLDHSAVATKLTVSLPPSMEAPVPRDAAAWIGDLPFLNSPVPIA